MHVLKAVMIAFSIYSQIPVPQFEWEEEDMQYMLCFFPWIGAVIGGCVYGWSFLCSTFHIGKICHTLIGTAIPLILTGGFHVDGFMDTVDAFHSYESRERKLEILKDPHIGAFAVILLAAYGLLYMGAFSEVTDERLLKIVCSGFFLSRCLSGISVVTFPSARKEGMLYLFADSSKKTIVKGALCLQSIACIGFMLWQLVYAGVLVVLTACLLFLSYYRRTKRELGGITGDTAGYFVLVCEAGMMLVAAAINVQI